jgi:signal peptidase I
MENNPTVETTQKKKYGLTAMIFDVVSIFTTALVIIAVLFTFCIRFVIVSGDSMFNTLVDRDYLIVMERHLAGEPEQGDIVVASMDRFWEGKPIVKRVIATEGQTVDIDFNAGIVYVDGVALEEEYTFTPTNLSEGTRFPLVVEEGCLFLMGDNRNESRDSRDPSIGQVDRREILGKAVFLLVPGSGSYKHPVQKDWGRIGGLN